VSHIRIVIEVEEDELTLPFTNRRDWEDALFEGGITVHVESVERVPS
jgi:hypothetical protein